MGQRLHHDVLEARRIHRIDLAGFAILPEQDLRHRLGTVAEGSKSHRRHVEDAAHRIDVDAAIASAARDLLWREIAELAFDLACLGALVQLMASLCDAEVADLHLTLHRDENVRWRDVAVNDAQRLAILIESFVRCMQPGAGVGANANGNGDVERCEVVAVTEHTAQAVTRNPLHGHEHRAVVPIESRRFGTRSGARSRRRWSPHR